MHHALQNIQLDLGTGQVGFNNPALRHEHGRQVGVVVNRQPVRAHRQHFVHRAHHAVYRLQRQAVNQINADRLKPCGAGGVDDQAGFFFGLDAIHCRLHRRLKVLHPNRHPVKTHGSQQAHGFCRYFAWVNFNRKLTPSGQGKVLTNAVHQPRHLAIGQERGRAAAKVQLNDFVLAFA